MITQEQKQIAIGEYIGAKFINDAQDEFPNGYYMTRNARFDLPLKVNDWEFDCNYIWQMLVLEQIAIDYCGDIQFVINNVLKFNNKWKTPNDLFEAIYNYIAK